MRALLNRLPGEWPRNEMLDRLLKTYSMPPDCTRPSGIEPIIPALPIHHAAISPTRLQSRPKMLGKLQSLRLVVGADALTVHGVGPRQHFFVDQAADDLAMLEDERHLARAHFQHGAGALPAGPGIAEAGIEEAGIMHAEFADQGIERHHLGGVVRRHLDGLLGGENIKLAGIEDQTAVAPCRDRLPEFLDGIAAAAVDIDHAGVALGAIADET